MFNPSILSYPYRVCPPRDIDEELNTFIDLYKILDLVIYNTKFMTSGQNNRYKLQIQLVVFSIKRKNEDNNQSKI